MAVCTTVFSTSAATIGAECNFIHWFFCFIAPEIQPSPSVTQESYAKLTDGGKNDDRKIVLLYLVRNPSSYRFGMAVPRDLQPAFGKKELRGCIMTQPLWPLRKIEGLSPPLAGGTQWDAA